MIALDAISAIYPVPDEFVSAEQRDRFYGSDLPGLSLGDLRRELTALEILNFASDSEWHLERERLVVAELERRRV